MNFAVSNFSPFLIYLTFDPVLFNSDPIQDNIPLICLPNQLIKFQYSDIVNFESGQVWCCIGVGCLLLQFAANLFVGPVCRI